MTAPSPTGSSPPLRAAAWLPGTNPGLPKDWLRTTPLVGKSIGASICGFSGPWATPTPASSPSTTRRFRPQGRAWVPRGVLALPRPSPAGSRGCTAGPKPPRADPAALHGLQRAAGGSSASKRSKVSRMSWCLSSASDRTRRFLGQLDFLFTSAPTVTGRRISRVQDSGKHDFEGSVPATFRHRAAVRAGEEVSPAPHLQSRTCRLYLCITSWGLRDTKSSGCGEAIPMTWLACRVTVVSKRLRANRALPKVSSR